MTADSWKSLIIKILLMILTPLAAQLHLTLGATDLSAIAADLADLAVLAYGVYRSNGMKLVPHTAVAIDPHTPKDATAPIGASVAGKVIGALLVAFALAAVVALLLATPSRAGDIAAPVTAINKAAAPAVQSYGTDGLYFGVFTQGGGGSVDSSVAGINSASLVTNQIGIGGAVGYARTVAAGAAFIAVEGMASVNNVNGSQPGFSWNGPASFAERFKIGLPLDKVLALIPNLGLPTAAPFPVLPQGVSLLNAKSYLSGAFHQDDNSYALKGLPAFSAVKLSGGLGAGVIGQLSNGTALDVWTEIVFANSDRCFGAIRVCAKEGNKYQVGLGVWF